MALEMWRLYLSRDDVAHPPDDSRWELVGEGGDMMRAVRALWRLGIADAAQAYERARENGYVCFANGVMLKVKEGSF